MILVSDSITLVSSWVRQPTSQLPAVDPAGPAVALGGDPGQRLGRIQLQSAAIGDTPRLQPPPTTTRPEPFGRPCPKHGLDQDDPDWTVVRAAGPQRFKGHVNELGGSWVYRLTTLRLVPPPV